MRHVAIAPGWASNAFPAAGAPLRGAFVGLQFAGGFSDRQRLLELQLGLRVSSVVRGICVPGVARQSGAGVIRLVHGAVNAHSLDAFFGRCAWRAQGIVGVPTVASTILLNDGSSIWPVAARRAHHGGRGGDGAFCRACPQSASVCSQLLKFDVQA